MGLLDGIKGLFRGEHSERRYRWSFIFLDALSEIRQRDSVDVNLFVTYQLERNPTDGKTYCRPNFEYQRERGFDCYIDIYFFSINGQKIIEVRDSLTPARQQDIILEHRLYPLIRESSPVYWIFMTNAHHTSSSQIVTSIRRVFAALPSKEEVKTPLGRARQHSLPTHIR